MLQSEAPLDSKVSQPGLERAIQKSTAILCAAVEWRFRSQQSLYVQKDGTALITNWGSTIQTTVSIADKVKED